jgi:hypothetical protein
MFSGTTGVTRKFVGSLLLASAAALVLEAGAIEPARAEQPATTLATLLDKAQIQDMIVDYYSELGASSNNFGAFYVEDGVLDVNGMVAQGQKPIEDLYRKIGAGSPHLPGAFRMLLTNLKVAVNGETATADMIWTGVNSASPTSTPQFVEQGREHDELVKRNGHWLFKHRVITSDGGLQPMFLNTYKKR